MRPDPTTKAALFGGFLLFSTFYFLTISLPLTRTLGVYNAQRAVELTSLISLCLLFPTRTYPKGITGLALALFFTSGLISALLAAQPLWAAVEYLRFLLLFSLAFRIAAASDDSRQKFQYALGLLAATLAIKVSIGLYVVGDLGGGIAALADAFSNHRHFAEFLIAIESFLAFSLLNSQKSHVSILATIPLAIITIVISMGAARGSTVALLASALVFILLSRTRKLQSATIVLTSLIAGWAIYELSLAPPVELSIVRKTDSGRLSLWGTAIKYWVDYPLLGLGPMHFASIPNDIASHPHNALIQFLCEWGVAGLGSIAIFFAAWWHSALTTQRNGQKQHYLQ